MNISELARILKVTPQELHDTLPELGYDIGQKAIKINQNLANRLIRDWPRLKRQLERRRTEQEAEKRAKEERLQSGISIEVGPFITVREFAALTGVPLSKILSELMKNGIFSSLNEKIDYDTAWLIGQEIGVEVKRAESKLEETAKTVGQDRLKEVLAAETNLVPRPPVIVVMGHVDHGKTKLLDAIRRTNVAAGEAGGITQHIGAYQVIRNNKPITFIDTPGHEAFTAMRSRGARVADIAILVVAADDGVMPQTIEAYRIIEAAKLPFVVAINKIDKPEANLDRVKQELSSKLNILPEDWGGKIVCAPVSALNGTGINELLDLVLLTAETSAEGMAANPSAPAIGTIIESHVDKGAGPVATMLVQNGTLHIGDPLMINGLNVGKVRCLYNYLNEKVAEASPAMPAQIIGFKTMPAVGDIVEVGEGERVKAKIIKRMSEADEQLKEGAAVEESNVKKINVIIKSDVLGSAEAIEESLQKIGNRKVKIVIVHKGLGNIGDGDLKRAEATGARILGFNVKLPTNLVDVAREKNVTVKIYSIIYDLINDIKQEMQAMIEPIYERRDLGELEVLAVFHSDKRTQVVGGRVISGYVENEALFDLKRNGKFQDEGKLISLQSGKQDVKQVEQGNECGLKLECQTPIQKGDILVFHKKVEVKEKL